MSNLMSNLVEQQLLSTMMIKPHTADIIMADVPAEAFAYLYNQEVYELLCEAKKEGQSLDPVAISLLRENFNCDNTSVLAYTATLYSQGTAFIDPSPLMSKLLDFHNKRQLVTILRETAAICQTESNFIQCAGKAQTAMLAIGYEEDHKGVDSAATLLPDLKETLRKRMDGAEGEAGLLTGLRNMDRLLAGLRGGHLMVLAARPSEGKTTLALNIAENIAEKGVGVLFFSIEMSKGELMGRLTASLGRIPSSKLLDGELDNYSQHLTSAFEKIESLPLYICSEGSITAERIRSVSRLYKRIHNIGLILIDYIGIVDTMSGKQRHHNRTEAIGNVSRNFKQMSKELDIPVIALCQLNRELDKTDREPRLSDLRDSGEIEQDADIIAFLQRTADEGVSKIIVAKHRHAAIGHTFLRLNGEISRFEDIGYTPALSAPKLSFGDKYGKSN